MIKKCAAISTIMIIICFVTISSALAKASQARTRAGKSNIGHLYLVERDLSTWDVIPGGAWGKMQYNLSGPEFCFVFNGHGLKIEENYTLIYYPDPWPGNGLICLGSGVVDEYGNIHIQGYADTDDLPIETDTNSGAKIWLVLSDDVDCDNAKMAGWNGAEYLFEYNLITFDDTDE